MNVSEWLDKTEGDCLRQFERFQETQRRAMERAGCDPSDIDRFLREQRSQLMDGMRQVQTLGVAMATRQALTPPPTRVQ